MSEGSPLFGKDGKPSSSFLKLLRDPQKHAILLKHLGKNVKESRQKKYESPTAQMRRMQLQNDKSSSNSKDSQHDIRKEPLPIHEILKDVVAFVDVNGRHGDMSKPVKAVMKSMGATIAETISSRVTHVIYKVGFEYYYYIMTKSSLSSLQ